MSAIRDKATRILAQVPDEVRSDRNPALFKTLTNGVTQEILKADWEGGGIRTVCIDFVCWYAGQMGIDIMSSIPAKSRKPKLDGFFNLHETLKKCGKGYAWVTATQDGPKPQCGDILRHTAFHVDIAVGFDGEKLLRVAGGQQSAHPRPKKDAPIPRPKLDVSKEYDNVQRVSGTAPYDFTKLQGWLDIELFFGGPPAPDSGKTGSLWFNEDGDVVHPNAPVGGGGAGFFQAAGPLTAIAYNDSLPHPASSAARTLDPFEIQEQQEDRTL